MGVMACDRSGCSNIMCDLILTMGHEQSYICHDCYGELCEAKSHWPRSMSEVELVEAVRDFMASWPGSGRMLEGDDLDRRFEQMVRNVYEDRS